MHFCPSINTSVLDAILENDHKLTASQRGRLWSTTTSVLGVKYSTLVYGILADTTITQDTSETGFFSFQRLSIALKRGNAV